VLLGKLRFFGSRRPGTPFFDNANGYWEVEICAQVVAVTPNHRKAWAFGVKSKVRFSSASMCFSGWFLLQQKTLQACTELSRSTPLVTLSLETAYRREDRMSDLTVEAATKQVSAMASQN
jgi:hypothetical protein